MSAQPSLPLRLLNLANRSKPLTSNYLLVRHITLPEVKVSSKKGSKTPKTTRYYKNVLVSMDGESVGAITAETKQLYISIETLVLKTRAMSTANELLIKIINL